MFPLSDDTHPRAHQTRPYVTMTLVALNVVAFIGMFVGGFERVVAEYGFVTARFLAGGGWVTLVTSLFLHGGIGHIVGNMWFLWVFGDNVEYSMGVVRYLLFYLLAGIVATLVFIPFAADPTIPLVGASGAISGVLGAYARLFPRNRVRGLVFLFFFIQVVALPAAIYVALWFVYQVLLIGAATPIAYMAHIGGFLFGLLVAPWFARDDTVDAQKWEYIAPKAQ